MKAVRFGVVLDVVVPLEVLYHVQVQHSTLAILDMSDAFIVNTMLTRKSRQ